MRVRHRQSRNCDESQALKALKWVLVVLCIFIALLDHLVFPGWGRVVVLTILTFGSVLFICRSYWGLPFWAAMAGLFGVHSVSILHFRSEINQLRFPVLFLCAVVEVFAIALVLGLVFPDDRQAKLGK